MTSYKKHYMLSLTKRKHIVAWAKERGVAKPGYPGIIVADAKAEDLKECVKVFRDGQ
jgi:hypothetical protein